MRYRLVFVVALLAVGGGAYFYLQPGTDDKPAATADKAKPPVPVSVAQATLQDIPQRLEVVGQGEAFATVTLRPRIDGLVADVLFAEGARVQAGDVLVRLDIADLVARLRQAEATLARDQALLARARSDLARYAALREQGFVSEEKVNEVRANAAALEATLRADQAGVDLARLQLGYTEIRAPFAGAVGAKLVFPGATVKANDTSLAVINRVRPLHVAFTVPERHLSVLRAAMAGGTLVAEVRVPGSTGVGSPGKVTFIDPTVDTASGTVRLKATLANADDAFAPGQFVSVRLTLDTWRDAVTVPAQAVQQGPEGSFVFVVRPDKGVAVRPVTLLASSAGLAVIGTGLAGGETVVTDGHVRLTAKSKVAIKPPVGGAAAGR